MALRSERPSLIASNYILTNLSICSILWQEGSFLYMNIFIFATLVAVIFMIPTFIVFIRQGRRNTEQLRLVEVDVAKHIPLSVERLHILQISDMHMEHLSIVPAQIVEALAGKRVDLIALTGDFLDKVRSLSKLEPYLQMLQALRPRYGLYAVLGNHDYLLRPNALQKLRQLLERYDVTLLHNEHVTLNMNQQQLHVVGIDNYGTGHCDIERSFANLGNGCRLVLTHDPNVVLELAGKPYNYLLSGHFHGGQIHWPKPFHLVKMGKLARQKRVRGLHYEHGRAFYISEGLGQTGVNLRLGSWPEITLHQMPVVPVDSHNE